jgi:RNA polymerase sigma-70 factor (ECF subfamily)
MAEIEDRELVLRARRGETAAFGELVRRYQTTVFNVCYRLLGNRPDAEDLTQEALIRAHQRLHLFDADRALGPWLRKVAANLCLNQLESTPPTSLSLGDEEDRLVEQTQQQPEQLVLSHERNAQIRQALSRLPPAYRLAIELRHFQELSYEEMAVVLQLPLSSIKTNLFRARKQLAALLKNDEPLP